MDLRPPAVAGMFYPGEPQALRNAVQGFLDAAPPLPQPALRWPKALVVPHAGYVYSGATAARGFAELAPGRGTVRRVVLLGPVHRVPVRGLALPGVDGFQTPLGVIPLDAAGVRQLAALPQVVLSPRAHAQEHSLEVQLPFLQQVLGAFTLLPLAVGDATPQQVADVLLAVWGGPETVIVISSDLSHYLPYDSARRTDAATVRRMLQGQSDLDHQQACGATPVNGLLLAAAARGLAPRLLHLCNSGDTAGDKGRVVGYASLAFDGDADAVPAADGLPADAGATLLALARAAITQALGRPPAPVRDAPWLRQPGASFVTLKRAGQLRGCIGTLEAHRPLLQDVAANAVAAALRDSRFPPVTGAELDQLCVEVSVLSAPEPLPALDEADAIARLRPGVDGVVLRHGARRATFLPQVWEQLPEPRQFLAQLKRKAGLPPDFWDANLHLERYTVRKWSEADAGGPA